MGEVVQSDAASMVEMSVGDPDQRRADTQVETKSVIRRQ